jgi:hypothetical protein
MGVSLILGTYPQFPSSMNARTDLLPGGSLATFAARRRPSTLASIHEDTAFSGYALRNYQRTPVQASAELMRSIVACRKFD